MRTCIAKEPYIFVIFQRAGIPAPHPSLDSRMMAEDIIKFLSTLNDYPRDYGTDTIIDPLTWSFPLALSWTGLW